MLYTTLHANVTKLAPFVLLRHPVLKTKLSTVVHATVEKYFQNHLVLIVKGKVVCQWRQVCRNCSFLVISKNKHECLKKFCTNCNKLQPSSHFCYVAPLKPSKLSDRFLDVFFDTECTQDIENCDGSFEHVPNRICDQQMCSKCEAVDDLCAECEHCGKRTQMFWQDSVD